jgi:hypothetical protein
LLKILCRSGHFTPSITAMSSSSMPGTILSIEKSSSMFYWIVDRCNKSSLPSPFLQAFPIVLLVLFSLWFWNQRLAVQVWDISTFVACSWVLCWGGSPDTTSSGMYIPSETFFCCDGYSCLWSWYYVFITPVRSSSVKVSDILHWIVTWVKSCFQYFADAP